MRQALAAERLEVYQEDGVGSQLMLARYLWNQALCEALYSPLQMVEVALRNALHAALTRHFASERWYEEVGCQALLTHAQRCQLEEAKATLGRRKRSPTPGRVVAELTFGFWTGFFNKHFAQNGMMVNVTTRAFRSAPKHQRDIRSLNHRLTLLRELRNRVFHHERILHWNDLDDRYAALLETIGWLSPEVRELTQALDRFVATRKAGPTPWMEKLAKHWPEEPLQTPHAYTKLQVVPQPIPATDGADTPFGMRWGGEVIQLGEAHLQALRDQQTLAVDVMGEYITYLQHSPACTEPASISA